jgi:hypothetical protein
MTGAGKPEGLPGSQVEQPSDENIIFPEEKDKLSVDLATIPHFPSLRMAGLCLSISPWEKGQEAAMEAERTRLIRNRMANLESISLLSLFP